MNGKEKTTIWIDILCHGLGLQELSRLLIQEILRNEETGNAETERLGDTETRGHRDETERRRGDAETQRHRDVKPQR